MKFLVAFEKGDKKLLKIELDNGEQKWATCSGEVFNYAKSNFKSKDNAVFEMTEKAGQFNVTKISKVGGSTSTSSEPSSDTAKCSDCGATLKDSKYKKCFSCNKKSPAKTESKAYEGRSAEVTASIIRQTVMKVSGDAVATAMVGQIGDVDALAEMICKLYDKLLEKISS